MPNLAKPFSTTAPLGIANRAAETHLPEKTVWDAVNLDITPDGTFWTRRGYTRVRTGHYHSLFAHPAFPFALAAHDGQLVRIAADLTETSLTAVVGPVSYAALDQTVYWSDGVTTGRVTVTTATAWGLPVPALPTLTATAAADKKKESDPKIAEARTAFEEILKAHDDMVHTAEALARATDDADRKSLAAILSGLRASGKVLTADKLLSIAATVGLKRFTDDAAFRHGYALAAVSAMGKPVLRVDVENNHIGY